jgi:drug/metabolite transporter (DMT)-like permease
VTARHGGLLALLALLWGASYLLIKYALEGFSAVGIVFWRALLAAAVLYVIIRVQGGEARAALSDLRKRPWHAVGFGFIQVAAPFTLISLGEHHVPSGLTAVLIAPSPLFVAAFAPLLMHSERIGGRQWIGLIVGLVGVATLVGVETIDKTNQFIGALAILLASACYGLGSIVVKRWYADVPPVTASFLSIGTAAVMTLPFAAATTAGHHPGLRAILAVAGLGVGGTALAFIIYYRLIGELGAGRATLVSYLIPPVALAYGAVLLDEKVTVAAVGGLALILGGVAVAGRKRAEPPPVETA